MGEMCDEADGERRMHLSSCHCSDSKTGTDVDVAFSRLHAIVLCVKDLEGLLIRQQLDHVAVYTPWPPGEIARAKHA